MTDEPHCARCGCTYAEHHKLHCEGRDGNCQCLGWRDPGSRLTAVDEAFQAENAEYDAAKATAAEDSCHVVDLVTFDGTVHASYVLGCRDLTEEGRAAFGQLVDATARRAAVDNPHGAVIQELMLASMRSRMDTLGVAGPCGDELCKCEHFQEEVKASMDAVNHPPHYTKHPSGVECIQITEHMNFNLGNATKYIWRAGEKDGTTAATDLAKARWYLDREIVRINGAEAGN